MGDKKLMRMCPVCQRVSHKGLVAHLRVHERSGEVVNDNGFWLTTDSQLIRTSVSRGDEAALGAALDVAAIFHCSKTPHEDLADYLGFDKEKVLTLMRARKKYSKFIMSQK